MAFASSALMIWGIMRTLHGLHKMKRNF